jgi:predicted dehydrogenase
MKVGIIGVGFMGTTHAEAWSDTGADVVGFAAETSGEAETLSALYGGKVFPDLEAMLQEVDVIDICTPTHLHHAMVLQSAAAGVNIICEKPLARTVEHAQEMVQACQQAGVQLLVAHVVRFFPEYALAQRAVADGRIGRPGVVRLTRASYRPKKPVGNWFLDESKSGGILMDLMIHDYDYARWIAGDVESVFAKKITQGHPDSPVDYGLAVLTHKDGALSHIAGGWAYPPPAFRTSLEIFGEAGLIEFDSEDTAPIQNLLAQIEDSDSPDVAIPSSPVSESPYSTQIREFYSAFQTGRPARVSAGDGLAAVQIAQAAIQSAQSGSAVRLDPLAEVGS